MGLSIPGVEIVAGAMEDFSFHDSIREADGLFDCRRLVLERPRRKEQSAAAATMPPGVHRRLRGAHTAGQAAHVHHNAHATGAGVGALARVASSARWSAAARRPGRCSRRCFGRVSALFFVVVVGTCG